MELSRQRWRVRQGSPSSASRARDTRTHSKPYSSLDEDMQLSGQRWRVRQGSPSSASRASETRTRSKAYDSGIAWRSTSGRSAEAFRRTFGNASQNSAMLFPKVVAQPSRVASFDEFFSTALKTAATRRAKTRQLHESLSLPLLSPHTIRGMRSQQASKLSASKLSLDDEEVVVESYEKCNSVFFSSSRRGAISDVSREDMHKLNNLATRCAMALGEDSDDDEPSTDSISAPASPSSDKRESRIRGFHHAQALSSTNLKTVCETPSNQNTKAQDPHEVTEILQLPDMSKIFSRILSDEENLDLAERDRLALAFNQVKLPGDADIHADCLQDVLSTLGYLSNDEAKVNEIHESLTQYATLDFDEVCQFVQLYNRFEKNHVSQVFETYDADGSGELDIVEVRNVLEALGCSPFKGTLQRLIATVDMDSSGTLDYREFVLLVVVYKSTDGFSHKEIRELWRVFCRFAEQIPGSETVMRFPVDKLRDAVVLMGGPQAAAPLEKVLSMVNAIGSSCKGTDELDGESRRDEGSSGAGENGSLRFRQFVSWARRVKEAEIQEYVTQFKLFDQSGDEVLDASEIREAMHAMGYTPVRSTVRYLCKQVDADGSGTLNLEEFLELMEYNKKWDGFTRDQVDTLKKLFNRFKSDDGEIMAVQVRELLLLGGWKPSIRVIHEVILQVDVDGSHSLNFRESLRLVRLFREAHLERLKEAFAIALSKIAPDEDTEEQEKEEDREGKDERSRTFIPLKKIRSALSSVGYGFAKKELSDIISKTFASYEGEAELDQVDFDRFVDLCDACRIDLLQKNQRQAGFSDAEVLDYRLCFCRNDADRSGAIDRDEVLGLISELGLELQTKEDQRQLISLIQDARRAAADADVPEAAMGKLSSPPLPVQFPVFLHLCRLLFRQRATRHLEKENEEGLTLAFTEGEVASLRALFSHWVMFHSIDEGGDPKKSGHVLSTLPLSGLRKLVRDVVQDVSDETLEKLEEQVEKTKSELAGERPELAIQGSQVDFVVFLHVLRCMLNFGFFSAKEWPQLCGSKQ